MTFFFLLKMSSTIDAAIIKALVEHIGSNPDDGSSDTIDVSKYQEYPSDSVQVSSDQCIIDTNKITPKVGDIMYIPNGLSSIGDIIGFITRIELQEIIVVFKRGVYGATYEFMRSDSNNNQYIFSDQISPTDTVKFYTTTGIKLNNPTFLECYFYDIERRLRNVVDYVENQQSQLPQ